jgi:cytochrome c oxidase cbb3-type subunit III
MSDFTSSFWHYAVAIVTVVAIVGCAIFLRAMSTHRVEPGSRSTTGHVWDEDLGEYNNPMPRWWIWLFYITIVAGLAYLVLYPGLGSFPGSFAWTSQAEYQAELKLADASYGPIYAKYAAQDVKSLAGNVEARSIGQKLFLNHCAQCHGSDAGGGKGFPNLADNDWLWGGEPETIEATILGGRRATMPAWGKVLGDEGVKDAANYVRSLSGLVHDSLRASRGKETFTKICAGCHGQEGKGNTAIGAPNLTDKVWEYGSSEATIIETVARGRDAQMPSHKNLLGEAKVRLLAAYVYGLSNPPTKQ